MPLLIQGGHSIAFLQRRGTILEVDVVFQDLLIPAQVHEGDGRPDRLGVLGPGVRILRRSLKQAG